MSDINLSPVIRGGLLAAIVISIFEFALTGVMLAKEWESPMVALDRAPRGIGRVGPARFHDFK
jgi:hypothetical protein